MSLAKPSIPIRYQQHIALDDVSWDLYERLLRDIGNRPIRVSYYRGSIEIMSPLPKHEAWKKRIAWLIEVMALELRIRMYPLGSTTFRRKSRKVGLEPDECYYIKNAAKVRGKDRLDLDVDPPPDLVVEMDITRRSVAREPIYAALGVAEIWRYDAKRFTVLELTKGKYRERESSIAFPFLPMDEFRKFLERLRDEDELDVLSDFQKWVRTLKA